MAFNAYLLFEEASKDGIHPKGESPIEKNGIQLGDEWSFSLENALSIGPHTSGAGTGMVKFEDFTVKKKVDSSSNQLYEAAGRGSHFNNVKLKLLKATGDGSDPSDKNLFLQWTFKMFAVSKVEWSYADPDPEENVVFRFGVCQVEYWKQDSKGNLDTKYKGCWNVLKQTNDFSVPY